MRMGTGLMVAGVIALGSVRSAHADAHSERRTRADRHLARGLAHYEDGRYERAIEQFELGYAVEPRREFLFALGQAERLRGDCASAVVLYRQFLSRNPPARQVDAAWEHIATCDKVMARRRTPALSPAPTPAPAPAITVAPAVIAPAPPWYRDPIGTSLIGASVACAGASLALFVASSSARDSARLAPTYDAFDDLADRARARRNLGITLGVAAGALAGAAVYRLVWGQPARTRLELAPRSDGGAVAVGGSF